jgi:UDP-N-acetylmuramate--alanine ligase
VQTFGLAENCHWRGVERGVEHGRWTLEVRKAGETFVTLRVPLPGLHNAYNALATTALLHHAGLERRAIAPALEGFTGARRRMSLKGVADGITVVDDYAHHPTEIQATLKALAAAYEPRRIVCVFQPHQHSRTRFLLKDFAQSFALADEVIVPEIYFVRDSEQEKDHISAEDLVAQIRLRGGEAVYRASFEEILDHLESGSREGDLVVTMGAGNIWEVADAFIQRLG